jgi:hypothetical protein
MGVRGTCNANVKEWAAMDNDRLIALGLLKCMVDAGSVDFSLAGSSRRAA